MIYAKYETVRFLHVLIDKAMTFRAELPID